MTTDVAELITEPAEAAPTSTPSPEPPAELTAQAETPAAASGAETPAPVAPKPVSALAPREQESELQTLFQKGTTEGLSPAELQRRDALQGAVYQRREAERHQIEEFQRQETTREQELQQAFSTQKAAALENVKREINRAWESGRPVDEGLLDEYMERSFEAAREKSAAVHAMPLDATLRAALLNPDMLGDTVRNRRAFGAMGTMELISELAAVAYNKGQREGAPAGYKVYSDAEIAAVKQKAIDDLKASNPAIVSPTLNGGRPASNVGTRSWYMASSTTPDERANWERDNPDAFRRMLRGGA